MTSENLVNEIDNAIPAIHYMGTVDNISTAPTSANVGNLVAEASTGNFYVSTASGTYTALGGGYADSSYGTISDYCSYSVRIADVLNNNYFSEEFKKDMKDNYNFRVLDESLEKKDTIGWYLLDCKVKSDKNASRYTVDIRTIPEVWIVDLGIRIEIGVEDISIYAEGVYKSFECIVDEILDNIWKMVDRIQQGLEKDKLISSVTVKDTGNNIYTTDDNSITIDPYLPYSVSPYTVTTTPYIGDTITTWTNTITCDTGSALTAQTATNAIADSSVSAATYTTTSVY
jgi:hypothetical protein